VRLPFRHTGNTRLSTTHDNSVNGVLTLCYPWCCYGMQASEAVSHSTGSAAGSGTAEPGSSPKRQVHAPSFAKVLDGGKQPIRGLWEQNGRFYAPLKVEDSLTGEKKTRRIPLVRGVQNR
jgi:hypothetical protein